SAVHPIEERYVSYPLQPGQNPYGQAPMAPFPGSNEMASRPPSKGTTIATAILAVLGALWAIIQTIGSFTQVSSNSAELPELLNWLPWMQAIAFTVEVLTLGAGAVLLFMRKSLGRWLVTAGAAVHIIQGIVSVIAIVNSPAFTESGLTESEQSVAVGAGIVGLIIGLLPALATLILALLPPTGRWLNWTAPQQGGFPQQGGYPPQGGYPQQGGDPQQGGYPPQG